MRQNDDGDAMPPLILQVVEVRQLNDFGQWVVATGEFWTELVISGSDQCLGRVAADARMIFNYYFLLLRSSELI